MFNLIAQQQHTEAVRHETFPGCTLWLTGFSGAGKTSIATFVKNYLESRNIPNYMLDGDVIRRGLNVDLGFSNNDRTENIRRIAEVSRLMADAGVVCIVAFISPFKKDRDFARELHEIADLRFFEIHVSTPIATCIERDTKGLYAKAQRGEISGLTGIDSPYETPERPEIVVDTLRQSVEESAHAILDRLRRVKIIPDENKNPDHRDESSSSNSNQTNQLTSTSRNTSRTNDTSRKPDLDDMVDNSAQSSKASSRSQSDAEMETDTTRKRKKKAANKKRKGRKKDRR